MKKVVILGGYGDGLVAAQLIKDMRCSGIQIELVGFLNDHLNKNEKIMGLPVLGSIKDWLRFRDDCFFHTALHKVKQMKSRAKFIRELGIPEHKLISLVHPTATIADDVTIGHGSTICSHVTIQPGARIGAFNSIRAGANIGHDTTTENFCYIGPNATMTGRSQLKEGAHLGPNSVIIDGISLESYSIASAGSVIAKETTSSSIYIGNPARYVGAIE